MQTILTIVQVFLSIALIALVLIQHGRGADAGAAFGSGASATVFGSRGSSSFLSRATGILAALFFLTSMALAYYAAQGGKPAGLMDSADGMQAKVSATESPIPVPPVPQSQGSGEVPVVPGVESRSPISDVPVAPGVAPVPVESKPLVAPVEPTPAANHRAAELPAAEPARDEATKPETSKQEQEKSATTTVVPQDSGVTDEPRPEIPPAEQIR